MPLELDASKDIVVRIPYRSDRPYDPLRKALYTVDELMAGWNRPKKSLDQKIAAYYLKQGGQVPNNSEEALCQRIHDDYIDRLLLDFIKDESVAGAGPRKIVGIMGGHAQDRTSKYYTMIARIAYQLTKGGYCILTGGGPGVMEAANLGAYMSTYSLKDLEEALTLLRKAPSYPKSNPDDPKNTAAQKRYVEAALDVRREFPKGGTSLGVPTWAYSDEPTGQFASHIAKYFANSIREDGLLAIAAYGVIFGPGAAGTCQEIFQDAAHNSYWSFGSRGPMVFLGTEVYRCSPSLYDVVLAAANRDGYSDLLGIFDDAASTVQFIEQHPVVKKPGTLRTFGLSEQVYPLT